MKNLIQEETRRLKEMATDCVRATQNEQFEVYANELVDTFGIQACELRYFFKESELEVAIKGAAALIASALNANYEEEMPRLRVVK